MPSFQAGGNEPVIGRGRRGRRVVPTLAEINVVPLVDVMLVLLIIFMVTAPMIQRGLDVNLPVSRRAQQISAERVFVTLPYSFRTDRVVRVGDEPIRVELLAERMRQMMRNRTDRDVYLQGDGRLSVQDLVEVFDRLKDGGVEKVGIVTMRPEER